MSGKTPQVILGIDPGYDRVGWAVGRVKGTQVAVLAYGVIQTDRDNSILERYQQIITDLEKILKDHQPTRCRIESLFYGQYKTTANKVSEARGVILGVLLKYQLKIKEVSPQELKLAVTGYGRADKKAMEKMVRLQLDLQPEQIVDDAIDALGLLFCS